ncbi:hypothetical protein ACFQ10_42565 [Streptomyces indonesiensis]
MRMMLPARMVAAAWTICWVPAPFQSWESTLHSTSVSPRRASSALTCALVSP